MTPEPQQPSSLYISYAQKDEDLKQEFEDYLIIMQQSGLISGWAERQVQPGTDWSQIIDPRLHTADIILFLVSPGLLATGYCSGAEFQEAFRRFEASKAIIIPVPLHYANWSGTPLASLQSVLPPAKPVSSRSDRYEAWMHVDRSIRSVIGRQRY
jgi:hypothetical protein